MVCVRHTSGLGNGLLGSRAAVSSPQQVSRLLQASTRASPPHMPIDYFSCSRLAAR